MIDFQLNKSDLGSFKFLYMKIFKNKFSN